MHQQVYPTDATGGAGAFGGSRGVGGGVYPMHMISETPMSPYQPTTAGGYAYAPPTYQLPIYSDFKDEKSNQPAHCK